MVVMREIHQRLRRMFTPREFARWMTLREPLSSELIADMPRPGQAPANAYFAEVIALLYARGMFRSHRFYCDLLIARPRCAAEVAVIARCFKQTRSAALARELA